MENLHYNLTFEEAYDLVIHHGAGRTSDGSLIGPPVSIDEDIKGLGGTLSINKYDKLEIVETAHQVQKNDSIILESGDSISLYIYININTKNVVRARIYANNTSDFKKNEFRIKLISLDRCPDIQSGIKRLKEIIKLDERFSWVPLEIPLKSKFVTIKFLNFEPEDPNLDYNKGYVTPGWYFINDFYTNWQGPYKSSDEAYQDCLNEKWVNEKWVKENE